MLGDEAYLVENVVVLTYGARRGHKYTQCLTDSVNHKIAFTV
jgi:hypothetical protein